jgi:nucleoside-diphosphate-sugar epimerase
LKIENSFRGRIRVFDPILVTGASGFVGNCVVRRLLQQGHQVQVLLRPEARLWRLQGILERLAVHRADICDAAAVRAAVSAAKPQAVLHLATYGAYEAQADARRILVTNVLGSENLFEASLAAKARLIVNAGSSSEYGYRNEAMRESDVLAPNSVYALAKAAQTHLCSLLAQTSGCATATFRLFSVYGPWEEPSRLMPTVIRRARAGLPLEMVSPDTARDFIYIEDVLDGLLGFARLAGVRGAVYNLGSGVQSTMRDVVAAVQGAVGSKSEVRWGSMKARRWDTAHWQADISKARVELGWSPKYTLAEGVSRMADWMKEAGDDYPHGQS